MINVFVIEDNRTEGMLLRMVLSEIKDIKAQIFATATDMLAKIDQYPDIAIVDLMLPDMNGLELIKHIRNKSPQTRIVVVSAQRDIELLAQIQAQGVYNYLVKSEACLVYLRHVIDDLLIVINHLRNE